MARNLTIRLSDDLARWLERTSRRLGISRSSLVRQELERVRTAKKQPRFMLLAGSVDGPPSLSSRKGYSRK